MKKQLLSLPGDDNSHGNPPWSVSSPTIASLGHTPLSVSSPTTTWKQFFFSMVTSLFLFSITANAKDTTIVNKAKSWVKALNIDDTAKASRVVNVIATHLFTITEWNNTHPPSTVPAGINPATGQRLSEMDRQIIANSAMPASVHQNLMMGLRNDLAEEQVEQVLDMYTIGKVAFTMNGYHSIVQEMTAKEDSVILVFMKQAREQAVDFKSMKQISAIFEIYKTKSEQYLNANGRNWREMYRAYTDKIKAEKAKAVKKEQ